MVGTTSTSRLRSYLDAPLSGSWCLIGWCVSIALFMGIVMLTGGPALIDAGESVYSTWAIAHGQMSCAFPHTTVFSQPEIAPLYPLFSGTLAAIARIGHAVPFPTRPQMGPHCAVAYSVISRWAQRARAARRRCASPT